MEGLLGARRFPLKLRCDFSLIFEKLPYKSRNMVVKIACIVLLSMGVAVAVEDAVDFQRDVRPILSDKCFFCHGTDPETREADLRLDTPEGAYENLGGYSAVVPGKVKESELFLRITSNKKKEMMPPPESHKTLSPREIETLKKWIEQGAEYQEHWAYEPIKKADAPAGKEIDHFVTRKWDEAGIQGSKPASREVLLRRLSWDLRGIPPSTQEREEFLNDKSPDAWGSLVDRFLADPKYGERMAVWWLDLVRYADTIGYHSDNEMKVTPYRDYVVNAFNKNKPFTDFTIEQLAGDLLPDATLEQKVASGYNRLLQTTEEGGAQEKEYRAIYAADRVRNVSEVWLGSTLGCAQCHDHKYDPFTARDFYSMAAFFSDIRENGIGKRRPNLLVPSPAEESRIAELKKAIEDGQVEKLLKGDPAFRAKISTGMKAWLAEAELGHSVWRPVTFGDFKTPEGTTLKVLDDGTVLEGGKIAATASYLLKVTSPGKVSAIKLDALTHESFPVKNGFSRGNGNFVLTEIEIKKDGKKLKIVSVRADVEQDGFPASAAFDGNQKTGWAVGAHMPQGLKGTRRAAFILEKPIELKGNEALDVTLHYQSQHVSHSIARFALSVTAADHAGLEDPLGPSADVIEAFAASKRTPKQNDLLKNYYLSIAPEIVAQKEKRSSMEDELKKIEGGMRKMLVSEALDQPRMTRILPRGNWMDDSGEAVQPAVPKFLQKEMWKVEGRANRLDLAKWILHEDNPLTARSTMNRVWRLFFGRGLSPNVTDLGGQGEMPTHPRLLDWLASDFRDGGWDLKRMVKKIVSSQTYLQRSEVNSFLREKDSANNLLARQGRWRVEAEFVRDGALEIAGLLNDEKMGGSSVKPYQPAGFWQHLNFPKKTWKASEGGDLYRRSVYTFWCRTFPHPSMVAFDAPSREECTAERPRSNIPQQALAMLNDPIFVEAARVFGTRMAEYQGTVLEKMAWGLTEAFSREGTREELDLLMKVYQSQLKKFESDPDAATAFLSTGKWPLKTSVPAHEAAAWGQVGRVILNAYETTSRF